MTRPTASAAGLLLVAFACAHTPDRGDVREPIGCWYFDRNDAATALNLPWGIRLTGDSLTGWPAIDQRGGARVAATLTPDGDQGHPFGYWLETSGDSIEVGYPGGGGLVLRLAVSDTALTGIARPVGDALPLEPGPRPDRPVRLTPARCP